MNTLTSTKREVVNFLETLEFNNKGKCPDWRYQAWDSMSPYRSKRDGDQFKETHWVGIVDLKEVAYKGIKDYPLLIAYSRGLVADTYEDRHEDGAPRNSSVLIRYELSPVWPEILRAKRSRHRYFHVFIMETVYHDGSHKAFILAHRNKKVDDPHGFATHKPWPEEKVSKWISYASFNADRVESLGRFCILVQEPYNWMK